MISILSAVMGDYYPCTKWCTTLSTADLNRKEQVLGHRNFTTQSPSILRTRNKQQLKSENATLSCDLASSWDHFENQGPLTFEGSWDPKSRHPEG